MENILSQIKSAFILVFTFLLGHISNIQHPLIVLFFGFTFNIAFGIGADYHKYKNKFKIRKAYEGMKLMFSYASIAVFLYIITYKEKEIQTTVLSWLTYIVSYFYLVNIFRNLKIIFPKTQGIKFIYQFLSTEIFIRLKEYIGWRRDEEEQK